MSAPNASTKPLLKQHDGHSESWEEKFQKQVLKYKPRTPFQQHFQLALRGSTVVLLMGFWLMLPKNSSPLPHDFDVFQKKVMLNIYDASVPVLFVYTLTANVGATVYLGYTGLLGTVYSAFAAYFMFCIFPEGVKEVGDAAFIFCTIFGSVLTLVTLYLNLARNVKVFCVSNFVFHWMAFLTTDGYKPYCGRQLPWNCVGYTGADDYWYWYDFTKSTSEFRTVALACSAVGLAIIATLLPWPVLAIRRARSDAVIVVDTLCTTWDVIVETYCGDRLQLRKQDQVVHEMKKLESVVGSLQGNLNDSWYECLGKGKFQKSRVMLNGLDQVIKENFDRLQCALRNCVKEDFQGDHVKLMQPLKGDIQSLMKKAKELYAYSTLAALDGDVDAEEEARMKVLIEETKAAVTAFSEKFRQAKAKNLEKVLDKDLLDEHAFCYNVCVFARLSHEYADHLIKLDTKLETVGLDSETGGLKSVFSGLNTRDNLSFTFRNGLSILIAMSVGYHGCSKQIASGDVQIIPSLNAGIACTCTLLLSASAGSALLKNLNRVQGVVLATVIGQLLYGIFGTCTVQGYVVLSLLLWCWLVTTLFIYYHSPQFGMIGMLLAAFGTGFLLTGCDNDGYNPVTTAYTQTTGVVVAIFIMCTVDLTFGGKRSSKVAHLELVASLKQIAQRLRDLTDPTKAATDFKLQPRGKLSAQIGLTTSMGQEAALEPRFHRTPWRNSLFDRAVFTTRELRRNLVAMEMTAAEGGKLTSDKSRVFMHILKNMAGVNKMTMEFSKRIEDMEVLLHIFLDESDTDHNNDLYSDKAPFQFKYRQEHDQFIDNVLAEFNSAWKGKDYGSRVREVRGSTDNFTLEDDPTCQVGFAISCLNAMLDEMVNLQREILQD